MMLSTDCLWCFNIFLQNKRGGKVKLQTIVMLLSFSVLIVCAGEDFNQNSPKTKRQMQFLITMLMLNEFHLTDFYFFFISSFALY